METLIEFKDVTKQFQDKLALKQLNLKIKKGEIFVLVGPSGSGKTTTMKMINALHTPTSGTILFKDHDIQSYNIQKLRWQIGYVLQQIALFPTMTVEENIELIPEMLGWKKEERRTRVNELLKEVDLDPEIYAKRFPAELSGGEQQRIGILRALAAKPDVILMDEPFSALDPISREQLQDLVLRLHERLQNTIVFVTHDMDEAIKLGDRIAIMRSGELIQCTTPAEIAENPADQFVATFFKHQQTEESLTKLTLQELIDNGIYQTIMPENIQSLPKLDLQTPLSKVFVFFIEHESIGVIDQKTTHFVGTVNRSQLFTFLAKETQKST